MAFILGCLLLACAVLHCHGAMIAIMEASGGISWGETSDVKLLRSAAETVTLTGNLIVNGALTVSGTLTNSQLVSMSSQLTALLAWQASILANAEIAIQTATASSAYSVDWGAAKTIDSDPDSEWATNNQQVGAWLLFDFPQETVAKFCWTARKVVANENFTGVTLTFSDASVQGPFTLVADGSLNQCFSLTHKATTSVKFTCTSGAGGANIGASNVDIYRPID